MPKPTPSLEEEEEEKEVDAKVHRAADLFAESSSPRPPSHAQDLFADESPQPVSRAADLFADEEPKQLSRAEDLFADEPGMSRSVDLFADEPASNDLFADERFTSQTEDLFSDNGEDSNEPSVETTPEDESLRMYKALLVIRPLQVRSLPSYHDEHLILFSPYRPFSWLLRPFTTMP